MDISRSAWLLSFVALGCGELDAAKLEGRLKSELEERKVEVESVTCPKGRKAKKGDKFDCTAKTKSGQEIPIHCEQDDASGNVKYVIAGANMTEAKLGLLMELDLAKRIDEGKSTLNVAKVTVHCPAPEVFIAEGSEVLCDAKLLVVRLGDAPLKVAFTGESGKISWKPVDPTALDEIKAKRDEHLK